MTNKTTEILRNTRALRAIYLDTTTSRAYKASVPVQEKCIALIDQGVDFTLLEEEKETEERKELHLLHFAAWFDQPLVVSKWLEKDRVVDMRSKKQDTPLHYAAMYGSLQAAELLLDKGADIEARNDSQETPLLTCAKAPDDHLEMFHFLLQKGADLNARRRMGGYTALMIAAEANNLDIARLLLKAGVCVNARTDYSSNALHSAVTSGSAAMVQLLLNAGIEVNAADINGDTPLHELASNFQWYKKDSLEKLHLLIAAGADIEARNAMGQTPLAIATKKRRLIVTGIRGPASDEDEFSPFEKALLDKGASVYALGEISSDTTRKHKADWDKQLEKFYAGTWYPKTMRGWLGLASVMPLPDPQAHSPVALRVQWLQEYARQPALRQLHQQANAAAAIGWRP